MPLDRKLRPIPARLVEQRIALHRLATYVIAPARYEAEARFGLRWTEGGFGTPNFGDRQVRVAGSTLLDQHAGEVRGTPITSMQAAAEFIGSRIDAETAAEHDSPPIGDVDENLGVDEDAVQFLSEWWSFGTEALEAIRADDASVDASVVQLWPGHFDVAIEVGDEHRRASVGASPGDTSSDEPYLYVSAWWPDRLALADDGYWNAEGYTGAVLSYAMLKSADDPLATAIDFFRAGRDRLGAAPTKDTV